MSDVVEPDPTDRERLEGAVERWVGYPIATGVIEGACRHINAPASTRGFLDSDRHYDYYDFQSLGVRG